MKYAYIVHAGSGHSVEIIFDRVLASGFHSADIMDIVSTPQPIKDFLTAIGQVEGIDASKVWVQGAKLSFNVSPFIVAKTVERVVKRVQRRYAKGENRQRVAVSEMNTKALSLNITKELLARDIFVEAARILPNSDPIRLASAIKDLNLPPNEALQVLRGLAVEFKGDNADPIRLVSGYKTMLGILQNPS